jgi:hypothetical protein
MWLPPRLHSGRWSMIGTNTTFLTYMMCSYDDLIAGSQTAHYGFSWRQTRSWSLLRSLLYARMPGTRWRTNDSQYWIIVYLPDLHAVAHYPALLMHVPMGNQQGSRSNYVLA